MADNWVSPTGFVDPDTKWNSEGNAYDGDTGTSSTSAVIGAAWSSYLELTHAEIACNKVHFWVGGYTTVDVDVYYGAAWHNIYSATPAFDEWVEAAFGSTEDVTAARVRIYQPIGGQQRTVAIFEFEFNSLMTYTKTPTIDALLKALDSKTVSVGAYIRDTDVKTVDVDALLRNTDAISVTLGVLLGAGGIQEVDLDALLRAMDSETVTLDALLKTIESRGIDLDATLVDRLVSQLALDALLKGPATGSVDLDALLAGSGDTSLSLDIILSDTEYRAPYYIEIRDPDGLLLGVIRDIMGGTLEQATNVPDVLSFDIPANEIRAEYLSRKNQIWVRDAYTDTVISICRIQMAEDSD